MIILSHGLCLHLVTPKPYFRPQQLPKATSHYVFRVSQHPNFWDSTMKDPLNYKNEALGEEK